MPPDVDFRTNLIVDQHNPVLIQKAWRSYDPAGWAHLAAPYGEDALVWNVFRWLDLHGRLGDLGPFCGPQPVAEVLFWGCDPDGRADAQQELSIVLRGLDGTLGGTMTEPDLVLVTAGEVCFVECKLSPVAFPWKALARAPATLVVPEGEDPRGRDPTEARPADEDGWERRWRSYREHGIGRGLPRKPTAADWGVYQLVRNAVYARLLADRLGKPRAAVFSLVSRLQWALHPETDGQYHHFRDRCHGIADVLELTFWEDLRGALPAAPGAKLAEALGAVAHNAGHDVRRNVTKLRAADAATRRRSRTVVERLDVQLLVPQAANLVDCLGNTHGADVQDVVTARLGEMRGAGLPALTGGLTDSNSARRMACIDLLRRLGPAASGAVPALSGLVGTAGLSTRVKAAARDALRVIDPGDPAAPGATH